MQYRYHAHQLQIFRRDLARPIALTATEDAEQSGLVTNRQLLFTLLLSDVRIFGASCRQCFVAYNVDK